MEKSLKFSGMMSVSPYSVEFTVRDGNKEGDIDADQLFRILTGMNPEGYKAEYCGVEMAITMKILDNNLEIGGETE